MRVRLDARRRQLLDPGADATDLAVTDREASGFLRIDAESCREGDIARYPPLSEISERRVESPIWLGVRHGTGDRDGRVGLARAGRRPGRAADRVRRRGP